LPSPCRHLATALPPPCRHLAIITQNKITKNRQVHKIHDREFYVHQEILKIKNKNHPLLGEFWLDSRQRAGMEVVGNFTAVKFPTTDFLR